MLAADQIRAAVLVLYTGLTGIAIGFAAAVVIRQWRLPSRWPVVALGASFVGLALVNLVDQIWGDRRAWVVWSASIALAATLAGVFAMFVDARKGERA